MLKRPLSVAVAQIATDPGNISENTKKIIAYIDSAKKRKAEIIVFPELAIPGYESLDLMHHQKYIDDNKQALEKITKHTKDVFVIVGFIDQDKNIVGSDGNRVRYNSAAILYDQKLLAVQDKTLLPNYDVFFENRYFTQGRGSKLIDFKGVKIGVEICEDLWDENYPVKVSEDLIKKGADMLINISCSPFYIGKRADREGLIRRISATYKIPFIYVNCVGAQDGYDGELVFDGQSMVFNNKGQLIKLGKEFEEELFFVDDNDLKESDNNIDSSVSGQTEQLHKALVLGIRDYFRRSKMKKAFIGLSGGIDSAVTAAIAVEALGVDAVIGISMPSQYSSKGSIDDAKKLAKNLGIKFKIISINTMYDVAINTLASEFKGLEKDVTEENIQARLRGVILMAHANKLNGLVISTANKTEAALGYTTLYGDMCGAIAPIADVSKLKVYDLARLINRQAKKRIIPSSTIDKVPSAELRENQTDEQSLGATYRIISPLVDDIVEQMIPIKTLVKKYPRNIVEHISQLINKSEYKRRQAAPGIKVTKKAFGIGRRIPIVHNFVH